MSQSCVFIQKKASQQDGGATEEMKTKGAEKRKKIAKMWGAAPRFFQKNIGLPFSVWCERWSKRKRRGGRKKIHDQKSHLKQACKSRKFISFRDKQDMCGFSRSLDTLEKNLLSEVARHFVFVCLSRIKIHNFVLENEMPGGCSASSGQRGQMSPLGVERKLWVIFLFFFPLGDVVIASDLALLMSLPRDHYL